MGKEQRTSATALGIHDCGYCFSGAGGVVQQRDCFAVIPHRLQRFQRLDLVLFQIEPRAIQFLAALGGEIVLDLSKLRMASQKDSQLILYSFGLDLHLPYCPTINVPSQIHHAVLFEEIIIKFILRHKPRIMRRLIVNFDCDTASSILQHKICITTVLVNIIKMVLRIQVLRFLCTKSLTEQFDEQILRRAAGDRMIVFHGASPHTTLCKR